MSDDVTVIYCLINVYLFWQFFYHLPIPVWIVRGFTFEIREYSSDWAKI